MKRADQLMRALGPFGACSPSELRTIRRCSTVVVRPAGSVLAFEGSRSRELLIIASGVAVVLRDGELDVLLGAGDSFGDADVLAGRRSSGTLIALSDVELVVMSLPELSALLDNAPAFRRRVVASLAQRASGGDR